MATKQKVKINLPKLPPLTIKNAKLKWTNFQGTAKTYNAEGLRNFHVVIDNNSAQKLERDGWNIRWHEPKEDGDEAWASLKVAVGFEYYPPRVLLLSSKNKEGTALDQNTIGILDNVTIKNINLKITASPWDVNGKTGYKAWLSKAFVTIDPDDLEAEYLDSLASNRGDEDAG